MRKLPFDKARLEEIASKWPTPFHIYDAKEIKANAKRLKKAFSWNKGFREYFAVKAAPNPHLMKLLRDEFDFGSDCSSMAELVLAEKVGNVGESIMFTSNDTPAEEFRKAWELGAIINFDDVTHIDYCLDAVGADASSVAPRLFCCRYNPGPLKGGNAIIGKPEEAKYGFTREQLFAGYRRLKEAGASRFGLHTMVASNELDPEYIIDTAKMLFDLVADLTQQLGVTFEFVNIGGGIGIPYRPDQTAMDLDRVGKGIEVAYKAAVSGRGLSPLKLFMECGRCITGPYGYLVSRVRHIKNTYRMYAGLDACMSNLMRPALYGAYHEIVVPGKETCGETSVYDVTGSLCENNDKFAIQRVLPVLERGDLVYLYSTETHRVGHVMVYLGNNYVIHSTTIDEKYRGTLVAGIRPELQALYYGATRVMGVG